MKENGNGSALSWRRIQRSPQPSNTKEVRAEAQKIPLINAKTSWRDKDNWRAPAVKISEPVPDSFPKTSSADHGDGRVSAVPAVRSQNDSSLQSANRGRATGRSQFSASQWIPGFGGFGSSKSSNASGNKKMMTHQSHPQAQAHAKPALESGNQPKPHHPTLAQSQVRLGSSTATPSETSGFPQPIERSFGTSPRSLTAQEQSLPPATQLHPLKIGSLSHMNHASGLERAHASPSGRESGTKTENWALTPTSSLPSLPGTPHRLKDLTPDSTGSNGFPREASSVRGNFQPRRHDDRSNSSSRPPYELQTGPFRTSNAAPLTPNLGGGQGTFAASSLGRSLVSAISSSPKRSPLSLSSHSAATGPVHAPQAHVLVGQNLSTLSPNASPKPKTRTLSPIARNAAVFYDSPVQQPANIVTLLTPGGGTQTIPGLARRDSLASIASSAQGGHTLSRSRRGSQIMLPPQSPVGSTRSGKGPGLYRPPHLRNRGSASGLRPSVAHYDRVRTPSLRGHSRSRESSVSLSSRPGSRPPSTVPFSPSDTIPEGRAAHAPPLNRRRMSSLSSFGGSVAEEAHAALRHLKAWPEDHPSQTSQPEEALRDSLRASNAGLRNLYTADLDSESLMAKLKETHDGQGGDSEEDDDGDEEFYDLSAEDMMYGGSVAESFPLSRHESVSGHKVIGDLFEVGDRIGPGMEHDGHIIKIAETSSGFEEQEKDLTGSRLEIVRKLGEGSYAVVYLVREVPRYDDDDEGAFGLADDDDFPLGRGRPRSVAYGGRAGEADGSLDCSTASNLVSDEDADVTIPAEDVLSSTLKASGGTGQVSLGNVNTPVSALQKRRRSASAYRCREFALKCLCKRDLPDDMLEVQRLEATIHQSIPPHPNIVTLYRTYETPDWLFLVLEYCPGQDLYYWLEQAQDTSDAYRADASPSADDFNSRRGRQASEDSEKQGETSTGSFDATPPSPSLLASTAGNALLSRKRVRLVSRMFRQMCDAVQFCHDRGISHRDIKPENFIVEDRRSFDDSSDADNSLGTIGDSMRESEARVIVKMTDFGLATAEERCEDFDCGSKPYMAFECHNNISQSYDPRQADIWSLGVVLLNLLFHRSPFTEPSAEHCDSFAAYCYDPIKFLTESFDGLSEDMALFLAQNVFCEASTDPSHPTSRISAGEFSAWAADLVEHLGLGGSGPPKISRGASVCYTTPLVHSRTTSMSTLPSLLGSPRPLAPTLVREAGMDPFGPEANLRQFIVQSRRGSLSPHPGVQTPDVLPSPRFTPSPQPREEDPFAAAAATAAPPPSLDVSSSTLPEAGDETLDSAEVDAMLMCGNDANGAEAMNDESERHGDSSETKESSGAEESVDSSRSARFTDAASQVDPTHQAAVRMDDDAIEAGEEQVNQETQEDDPAKTPSEGGDSLRSPSIATSNATKRRKRGARKGRTLAKQQLKRSQSVEQMSQSGVLDPEARARERDAMIAELAAASQALARQMSKAIKSKPSSTSNSVPSSPGLLPISGAAAIPSSKFSLQQLASHRSLSTNDSPSVLIPNLSRDHEMGQGIVDSPPSSEAHLQSSNASSMSAASSSNYSAYGWTDRNRAGSFVSVGTRSTDASVGAESSGSAAGSSSASNWVSAATRRERMIADRKNAGGLTLQDSGRTKPTSWRERNHSTATFDSISTVSSISTSSSDASSLYSTASAPAALPRKDSHSRSRSKGLLGMAIGLDTISERERVRDRAIGRNQIDASYLAEIFGGDPKSRRKDGGRGGGADKERERRRDRELEKQRERQDERDRSRSDLAEAEATAQDEGKGKDKESDTSPEMNRGSEPPQVEPSMVPPTLAKEKSPVFLLSKRFVRPSSSSSSNLPPSTSGSNTGASQIAMRKDASTSTTSLDGDFELAAGTPRMADGSICIPANGGTSINMKKRRGSNATANTTSSRETVKELAKSIKGISLAMSSSPSPSNPNGSESPISSTAPLFASSSSSSSSSSNENQKKPSDAVSVTAASEPEQHQHSDSTTAAASASTLTPTSTISSTNSPHPVTSSSSSLSTKKKGMSKFLLGVRGSLMNRQS
ncbi:hypothetical protein IE53DRAFT_103936 [Violaceomyces palustris]|uniref:Uncharacterized protein n=1 Tax=Violaceomyces palustris TaxID=1673888 RepID=A0ACD0NWQ8_9BASI|nr:hypothetical protein IE53DRAFT_103936 [Violaceomyces palustris]